MNHLGRTPIEADGYCNKEPIFDLEDSAVDLPSVCTSNCYRRRPPLTRSSTWPLTCTFLDLDRTLSSVIPTRFNRRHSRDSGTTEDPVPRFDSLVHDQILQHHQHNQLHHQHDKVAARIRTQLPLQTAATAVLPVLVVSNASRNGVTARRSDSPVVALDARKKTTLARHYYPEGGWGWVVVTCTVMVHLLNHGLQLSWSVLQVSTATRFNTHITHTGWCSPSFDVDGDCSTPRNHNRYSTSRLVSELRQLFTLKQHYYPEGGWGWVVLWTGTIGQILGTGLQGAAGVIGTEVDRRFGLEGFNSAGWLGALSTAVALLVSPVTIAFCRRKSTRLTAVFGGLVTALGCLFTSFATQFHQLIFSYGTIVGVGVGMTRDCSTLMVAQYFKRRREFVEIFIVSGSGLGIAVMSAFIKGAISAIGWRFGLQAVTCAVFLTFFLGTFYRSASLYHPQRRAILHLKNQKRKIKDKNKVDDGPPFFDFSTLRSKTVRILLVSTGISSFGINTPIFYLAHQAEEEGLGETVVLLQTYLGLAWTLGCAAFGLVVVRNAVECRIARQYLCQASVFMCGLSMLALTTVRGSYHGYVLFAWIYGIFCGGYHYSLKMYTYERVRARNFARTWGFVQCSQAIPIAIGVPISGYINVGCGGKAGYYFSSTCVLAGCLALFLIDLHRRNLSRHKHLQANGTKHTCHSENCPQRKRLSFSQEHDHKPSALVLGVGANCHPEVASPHTDLVLSPGDKPELTCISEEGIADMDLPDNILDDLDYIGDCITSCNKVENYLMLSEFENNLIAEMPVILDRKGRRWSLARQSTATNAKEEPPPEDPDAATQLHPLPHPNPPSTASQRRGSKELTPSARTPNKWKTKRVITVIDEASV